MSIDRMTQKTVLAAFDKSTVVPPLRRRDVRRQVSLRSSHALRNSVPSAERRHYGTVGRVILAGLILLACVGARSMADDESKPKTTPEPKTQSAEEKKDTKPGEPSLLDTLLKELFKGVEDGPAKGAQPKENKLERAANGMRNAGDKLDETLTGEDTRKIQEQVIRDLDDLIKQLQNPPPPQGGGGGGGGGGTGGASGGQSGQAQRQQKLGGGQSSRSKGKPQTGQSAELNNSGGQDKKVAEGSQERTDSERKAAEEKARKKKLEIDVWGHLPPHLREDLLNNYSEKMLPKYQHLVKQFYEALSEQGEAPRR